MIFESSVMLKINLFLPELFNWKRKRLIQQFTSIFLLFSLCLGSIIFSGGGGSSRIGRAYSITRWLVD